MARAMRRWTEAARLCRRHAARLRRALYMWSLRLESRATLRAMQRWKYAVLDCRQRAAARDAAWLAAVRCMERTMMRSQRAMIVRGLAHWREVVRWQAVQSTVELQQAAWAEARAAVEARQVLETEKLRSKLEAEVREALRRQQREQEALANARQMEQLEELRWLRVKAALGAVLAQRQSQALTWAMWRWTQEVRALRQREEALVWAMRQWTQGVLKLRRRETALMTGVVQRMRRCRELRWRQVSWAMLRWKEALAAQRQCEAEQRQAARHMKHVLLRIHRATMAQGLFRWQSVVRWQRQLQEQYKKREEEHRPAKRALQRKAWKQGLAVPRMIELGNADLRRKLDSDQASLMTSYVEVLSMKSGTPSTALKEQQERRRVAMLVQETKAHQAELAKALRQQQREHARIMVDIQAASDAVVANRSRRSIPRSELASLRVHEQDGRAVLAESSKWRRKIQADAMALETMHRGLMGRMEALEAAVTLPW